MEFDKKYNELVLQLVKMDLTDAEMYELINQYMNFKDDHIEWFRHIEESSRDYDEEECEQDAKD